MALSENDAVLRETGMMRADKRARLSPPEVDTVNRQLLAQEEICNTVSLLVRKDCISNATRTDDLTAPESRPRPGSGSNEGLDISSSNETEPQKTDERRPSISSRAEKAHGHEDPLHFDENNACSHVQPEERDDSNDIFFILPDPVIVRPDEFSPRLVQNFLLNYPNVREDPTSTENLQFFNNEIPLRPRGCTIDDFHHLGFGAFDVLEDHHGYIQWIFPIREQGLNHYASPLQLHEARIIRRNPQMQARLLASLRLMLDFYGMALQENSLTITRHSDPLICTQQYRNLEFSFHNYLRLTRIFKSLCELGQQDYVPSIILFILAEQAENEELNNEVLKSSMDRFWVYCMRDREAQACVANAIKWVRDKDGEFTIQAYCNIVERKQDEGIWRFDPAEEGLQRKIRERKRRGIRGVFKGRLRNLQPS